MCSSTLQSLDPNPFRIAPILVSEPNLKRASYSLRMLGQQIHALFFFFHPFYFLFQVFLQFRHYREVTKSNPQNPIAPFNSSFQNNRRPYPITNPRFPQKTSLN